MDVRLVVEKGNKRRTWLLHQDATVVGRRRDCDLCILSAEVSRRHCVLRTENGRVHVEDLDSSNGTFVNGSRVVGKQVVKPGDHLQIGPMEFIVEYGLGLGHDPVARHELSTQVVPRGKPAEEDGIYDVVPLAEEDRKAEDVPLAMVDEAAEADWQLPPADELRDLLSQIEQPQVRPQRHKQ